MTLSEEHGERTSTVRLKSEINIELDEVLQMFEADPATKAVVMVTAEVVRFLSQVSILLARR